MGDKILPSHVRSDIFEESGHIRMGSETSVFGPPALF